MIDIKSSSYDKNVVDYVNPKFKTLDKVVISSKPIDQNKPDLIRYYGSDDKLINLEDFDEYGWKFLVEKLNYNSDFPLDNLLHSIKNQDLLKTLSNIKLINDTFCPTWIEVDSDDELISYFGSITVGKQKLILLDIPENYNRVNIYDTSISSTDAAIKVTIADGLDTKCRKIVWFVITMGGAESISDINLSFYAWNSSINPHRKMRQYLVRNDEFSELDRTINVVDTIDPSSNLWMDLSSGTIVGNKSVSSFPIMTSLFNKYASDSKWDKNVNYIEGSTATYNPEGTTSSDTWLALSDTKNEEPIYTNSWILEDYVNCIDNKYKFITIAYDYLDPLLESNNYRTNEYPGRISPNVFSVRTLNGGEYNDLIFQVTMVKGYVVYTDPMSFHSRSYDELGTYLRKTGTNYTFSFDYYNISDELWLFWSYKYNNNIVPYRISQLGVVIKSETSTDNEIILRFDKYYNKISLRTIDDGARANSSLNGVELYDSDNNLVTTDSIALGKKFKLVYKFDITKENISASDVKLNYYTDTMPGGESQLYDLIETETDPVDAKVGVNGSVGTLTINGEAKYPARYFYYISTSETYYTLVISDYTGFYVNTNTLSVKSGETSSFKISPADGVFDNINIDMDGATIISVKGGKTDPVVSNNITLTPPTGDIKYYTLEIKGITKDYTFKIWK
jgi:hypothetical protein